MLRSKSIVSIRDMHFDCVLASKPAIYFSRFSCLFQIVDPWRKEEFLHDFRDEIVAIGPTSGRECTVICANSSHFFRNDSIVRIGAGIQRPVFLRPELGRLFASILDTTSYTLYEFADPTRFTAARIDVAAHVEDGVSSMAAHLGAREFLLGTVSGKLLKGRRCTASGVIQTRQILSSHSDRIVHISSHEGRFIVLSRTGLISTVDTSKDENGDQFHGQLPPNIFQSASLSDNLLYAGDSTGRVYSFESSTKKAHRSRKTLSDSVRDVASDGELLVVVGDDLSIATLEATSLRTVTRLKSQREYIRDALVTNGEIFALVISSGRLVRISPNRTSELSPPKANYRTIASNAADQVLIGSDNGLLFAVDLKDGSPIQKRSFRSGVFWVCRWGDDIWLGLRSGEIVVLEAKGWGIDGRLKAHENNIGDGIFFENHLITCSDDGTLCFTDIDTRTIVRRVPLGTGPLNNCEIRDGILYVTSDSGYLTCLTLGDLASRRRLRLSESPLRALDVSGPFAIVGDKNGRVLLCDLELRNSVLVSEVGARVVKVGWNSKTNSVSVVSESGAGELEVGSANFNEIVQSRIRQEEKNPPGTTREREIGMGDETAVDFVVTFALEKELNAFLEHFPEWSQGKSAFGNWFHIEVRNRKGTQTYRVCAFSFAGMGNYEAAVATSKAIDVWNPRHVILGGIAGGVPREEFLLGDLVVADGIIAYEPGKQKDGGTERRFEYLRPAQELVDLTGTLTPADWALRSRVPRPDGTGERTIPSLHYGAVLSGEKVVADEAWFAKVLEDLGPRYTTTTSEVAGVEMEGFGVALAAYRADTAPGMIMAKSICDWADSTKNDGWQEYAAHVSASFIIALIEAADFMSGAEKPVAVRVEVRQFHRRSRIGLCQRLGEDWNDLADWYDLDDARRRQFPRGRECQALWDYLDQRKQLDSLPTALRGIRREDLLEELIPHGET